MIAPYGLTQALPEEGGREVDEVGEEDRPDSVASKTGMKEQKATNQFNFCERASQTLNNPPRVRSKLLIGSSRMDKILKSSF